MDHDLFIKLLDQFTSSVEAGTGKTLASLFTEDGIYHDTFYGTFKGPAAIAQMLEGLFWGDAEAFLWDMMDPVFDTKRQVGYARWVFSYTSTMDDSVGKRVVFDGISQFHLKDGLIKVYREVFSAGLALVQLEMDPKRTTRILERMLTLHNNHPEWRRHVSR